MIPWEHLDSAAVPGADGELKLMRRGAEHSIMLGRIELMNSRLSGSEEALAQLSCDAVADRAAPRMLIGGLGMGFTLRAALAHLPAAAAVTVAELVPAVVVWARGPMAHLHEGTLDDPRVTIAIADVADVIEVGKSSWDAILLDVDNGPEGLTSNVNDGLYDMAGLARARAALTAGGVLAVWSSAPDRGFTSRLQKSGFAVAEHRVHARRGKKRGARHTIWLATCPA